MSAAPREEKPPWSAVPRAPRERVERALASRVVRATRTYGGYVPSATFRLVLEDGRHAFFKGTYPRSIQRRQLKASLPWAAKLLGLPHPRWTAAIPD